MNNNVVLFIILLVILLPTLYYINKENFDGQMCFNTKFPKQTLYPKNQRLIDYSKFAIVPTTVEIPKVKKDNSKSVLDFFIPIFSRLSISNMLKF